MIETTYSIIIGLAAGALGGFVNSVVGWLAGTEPFNTRKNVSSIIVGLISGIGIAYGSLVALGEAQTTQALLGIIVLIFLSASGVSQLVHNVSRIAAKPPTP